jgi:hypothetical protein
VAFGEAEEARSGALFSYEQHGVELARRIVHGDDEVEVRLPLDRDMARAVTNTSSVGSFVFNVSRVASELVIVLRLLIFFGFDFLR